MDTDRIRVRRLLTTVAVTGIALTSVSSASAHGGAHTPIPQWAALFPLGFGIVLIGGTVALRRARDLHSSPALASVFSGIVFVALGAVGLVQLTPVAVPPIRYSPIARQLYEPLTLVAGVGLVLGSLLVGRLRWPTRPRYAALGAVLGLWIAYPALREGGMGPLANPLGSLIVPAVPLLVGYVLWRDCGDTLRRILADSVVRRFTAGVGMVAAVFFMFSTGMLTVVPDDGVGLPHTHPLTAVVPVKGPLVYWPAFEFWYPGVPIGGFLSPGMVILVVLIAGLVGLNAGIVAHQWRCQDGARASEGLAGSAALAAPNACCCCGPALAQVAVVAFGPSVAAPFYWLFVDIASPVGALFFVAAVALLTGNLVRFAGEPLSSVDPTRTNHAVSNGGADT